MYVSLFSSNNNTIITHFWLTLTPIQICCLDLNIVVLREFKYTRSVNYIMKCGTSGTLSENSVQRRALRSSQLVKRGYNYGRTIAVKV